MRCKRNGKAVAIRCVVLGVGLIVVLVGVVSHLHAQGVSSIAQGFRADDPNLAVGAIVSLKSGAANSVELSVPASVDQMIGVVSEHSLIELSSSGSSTVQVVTSGSAPMLVSDINGSIKTGDKITISPIAGVGMKATASTMVIGTAQANLSSVNAESQTIQDKSGKEKAVKIGSIATQVYKVYYQPAEATNSLVPAILQDFANAVAGHQVSAVRVILAALLAMVLLAVVFALLYSAVRSSIISIGRNPLSEQAVHKGLLEVGLSVAGLLLFACVVVYLILTT